MVKQTVKQKKQIRKPARHHWFLVSVFVVIIILALAAFILQRSTNLEVIAGEAVKQRIAETKQLALTEDQIKVALAIQEGKETEPFDCPESLAPAPEQHWKLKEGWKFYALQNVFAHCVYDRIYCYYADSGTEINRADQIVTYKDIPKVENCQPSVSKRGCDCELIK